MDQQTANWEHCLEHAALSDVGLRRANNQDAMAVVIADSQETWQRRGHLFMVADGMGAHAAGELASKLATDTVTLTYSKLLGVSPPEAIFAAVNDANAKIHSRGQADPEFHGMGTTSTSLLLLPQGALAAHVGDSRAYRLRGNRLEQLTFDHSLVWEIRAAGQIDNEEIRSQIPKNIITRSLGPNPKVRVDLEGPFPIEVGDTFLLCSDGLSGPVEDRELGAILASMPPAEAVAALVNLANLRGGPDNITVVVARVTGPQVARGQQADPPPAAARASTTQPVNPLIWTLLGVSGLATLGLFALGYLFASLVGLVVAVAVGIVVVALRYGGGERFQFTGRLLGRGPHTRCDCAPDAGFAEQLTEVVEQLRDAATKEDWTVDWHRFNTYLTEAAAARQSADYPRAVRELFHAISFMMDQLKHQRRTGGDSVLDP